MWITLSNVLLFSFTKAKNVKTTRLGLYYSPNFQSSCICWFLTNDLGWHGNSLTKLYCMSFTEKLLVLQLQNIGLYCRLDFRCQAWMHSIIVWCEKLSARCSCVFFVVFFVCRIHNGNLGNDRNPCSCWNIILHRSHTHTPTQRGSQGYVPWAAALFCTCGYADSGATEAPREEFRLSCGPHPHQICPSPMYTDEVCFVSIQHKIEQIFPPLSSIFLNVLKKRFGLFHNAF